jgi:serine phosphatase RsbU (regulator of sigma subunit)
MKRLIALVFILLNAISFGQNGVLELTEDKYTYSFAKDVLMLEDKDHSLSITDVIQLADSEFEAPTHEFPNLDFTSSRFWLRFSIHNNTDESHFILEAARPIVNEVNFYQVRGATVENEFISGDDYAYNEKVIPHRKHIFPVSIEPGETKAYYLEVMSDGEVLTLPVKIYDKIGFFEADYESQFHLGFYYGLMCLVILIYFFFFVLLKDKTFLFYIGYVFLQALLQFSLDGFSFQYFFNSGGYLANHMLLISAGLTIVALLQYVNSFLSLADNNRLLHKIFKVTQVVVFTAVLMSLIPGKLYEIAYPLINLLSLGSIILSVVAIYRLRYKKVDVDIYFAAAFTILIIGAIIFILGNFNIVGNADISQSALKISSALEVAILSISMSNKYRRLQKEKEEAQAVAMKSLEEQNALVEGMNVKLEAQVKERTAEIEHQKEELAEINEEILSSIVYAKRIQEAILPSDAHVKELMPASFVFYRPKDVVSGDFYFVEETTPNAKNKLVLFAAVDCTGHGVPGAFMSIVGNNFLHQAITEHTVNSPGEALDFLNKGVSSALRQDSAHSTTTVRDGMDISLCGFDNKTKKLYFAGAKNPVYIIRKSEDVSDLGFEYEEGGRNPLKDENDPIYLKEFKGDAHPIGAYVGDDLKPFTNYELQLKKDDMIYTFSDGFADQFGGPAGKKYKYKTFKKFLLSISQKPIDEQKILLIAEFDRWKGGHEQLDDVLVIGMRVE